MTADDGTWVPAFEGQRPPFEAGHELSTRHGAYSPRKVDPLAAELVALVLADQSCAHVRSLAFRPAVWSWARSEAQAQLLAEYVAEQAKVAGNGVGDLALEGVRAAYLLLHRAETRAANGRARLGLDPLSRARLGRDKAATQADTATAMAQLHRLEGQGRRLVDGVLVDVAPGELPDATEGGDAA